MLVKEENAPLSDCIADRAFMKRMVVKSFISNGLLFDGIVPASRNSVAEENLFRTPYPGKSP